MFEHELLGPLCSLHVLQRVPEGLVICTCAAVTASIRAMALLTVHRGRSPDRILRWDKWNYHPCLEEGLSTARLIIGRSLIGGYGKEM